MLAARILLLLLIVSAINSVYMTEISLVLDTDNQNQRCQDVYGSSVLQPVGGKGGRHGPSLNPPMDRSINRMPLLPLSITHDYNNGKF